jgi:hypothetical protein
MGFTASNLIISNKPTEDSNLPQSTPQLNVGEIEVLLSLIKRSSFLGEDIENLYNLIVKLQIQYLNQKK